MSKMRDDDQYEDNNNNEFERSKNKKMSSQHKIRKRNVMIKRDYYDHKDDPLVLCGFDIMLIILSCLDAHSVASTLLVSHRWHTVASSDVIWSKKCEELWRGKAHLPRISQIKGLTKLSTYFLSIEDGRREAPEYWRNLDPVWKRTELPMRRYFHLDGTQTADPGDPVWGGHECCYSIVSSFLEEGKMREHYVRINRWPKMMISRRKDWGWEMSNHLYRYSSLPDAYKIGGTGPTYLSAS